MRMKIVMLALAVSCLALPLWAGQADVISARVVAEPAGTYRFSVTVQHADQGWNHYANEWQVTGPDGAVYGTRTLYHPHVDEQPFTRSLAGVRIPDGVSTVIIRAGDSMHGYGGATVTLDLP